MVSPRSKKYIELSGNYCIPYNNIQKALDNMKKQRPIREWEQYAFRSSYQTQFGPVSYNKYAT